MVRHVAIYRHDLFKASEPFIEQQARAHAWRVTFVGRRLGGPDPPGLSYLLDTDRTAVARSLSAHPPDVVHAHFGVDVPGGLRLARRFGAVLVVTLHGFDVTRRRLSCVASGRPNLMKYGALRPHWLAVADQYLAVSAFIRDRAIDAGAHAGRVAVHHIGTRLPEAFPLSREHAQGPMRLIHVARLVEKKGGAALLRAVALSRAAGDDVELTVVGDGPLRRKLHSLAAELQLGGHVRFLGMLSHTKTLALIASADALCLPSVTARNGDAEGLGMVLLEAAAVGTPIIATSSGGIPDFVDADSTGLLVPQSDVPALAAAITRLHRDPPLSVMLSRRARERVEAEFDVVKQTALLEERFDALLSSRRR